MKTIKSLMTGLSFIAILLIGCGQDVSVVESGTYAGKVVEVNADEREIYVKLDNDKTIELYFTDSTALTKGGQQVEFAELNKDSNVKVKVEKMGKKLNPIAVKIKD